MCPPNPVFHVPLQPLLAPKLVYLLYDAKCFCPCVTVLLELVSTEENKAPLLIIMEWYKTENYDFKDRT